MFNSSGQITGNKDQAETAGLADRRARRTVASNACLQAQSNLLTSVVYRMFNQ